MVATAKIAKELLGDENFGESRSTSNALKQSKIETLKKSGTMHKTVREAKVILGKDAGLMNEDGRNLRKRVNPPTYNLTVLRAKAEAPAASKGSESQLAGTRSPSERKEQKKLSAKAPKRQSKIVSAAKKRKRPVLKRAGTMKVTAKEGKAFLSRGKKPVKRIGTMDATTKAGEEYLSRALK